MLLFGHILRLNYILQIFVCLPILGQEMEGTPHWEELCFQEMQDNQILKQDGVNLGYRDQPDQSPVSSVEKASDGPLPRSLSEPVARHYYQMVRNNTFALYSDTEHQLLVTHSQLNMQLFITHCLVEANRQNQNNCNY